MLSTSRRIYEMQHCRPSGAALSTRVRILCIELCTGLMVRIRRTKMFCALKVIRFLFDLVIWIQRYSLVGGGKDQSWATVGLQQLHGARNVCSLISRQTAHRCTDEQYRRGRPAYDKITGYIQKAKDAGGEILIGGTGKADSMIISDVLMILQVMTRRVTLYSLPLF